MSDVNGENKEVKPEGEKPSVPQVVSTPDGDQYICDQPGCERTFPTLQGVTMHRIRAHEQFWSGTPKPTPPASSVASPCMLCGKLITNARMRAHLRRVHKADEPTRIKRGRARMQELNTERQVTLHRPPVAAQLPEYRRPDEERLPIEVDDDTDDEPYAGSQIGDQGWEERAATVRRASAEFTRLTAERADYQLNLSAFTVADDVVILRDDSGGLWMLRRLV